MGHKEGHFLCQLAKCVNSLDTTEGIKKINNSFVISLWIRLATMQFNAILSGDLYIAIECPC